MRKNRYTSNGTLEGIRRVFPKYKFKIGRSHKRWSIKRLFLVTWKYVCPCAILPKNCLIHGKKICICGCGSYMYCYKGNSREGACQCGCTETRYNCPNKSCIICNKGKRIKDFRCIDCQPVAIKKIKLCINCDKNPRIKKSDKCVDCQPVVIKKVVGCSRIGCKFIDELETELVLKIKHKHADKITKTWIGDEFRPKEWKKKPVDGYIHETNTIIEFLGDIYHGHPRTWSQVSNHHGENLKELFTDTEKKLQKLSDFGYTIYYCWECDYRHKKTFQSVKSICFKFDGKLKH